MIKLANILGLWGVFLLLTGCSGNKGIEPQNLGNGIYTIPYGQSITLDSSNIKIEFQDVLSDSRCPPAADCVTAGLATIQFAISYNASVRQRNVPIIITLSTPGQATVNTLNYQIKLDELKPYALSLATIKKSDYIARVAITPL